MSTISPRTGLRRLVHAGDPGEPRWVCHLRTRLPDQPGTVSDFEVEVGGDRRDVPAVVRALHPRAALVSIRGATSAERSCS